MLQTPMPHKGSVRGPKGPIDLSWQSPGMAFCWQVQQQKGSSRARSFDTVQAARQRGWQILYLYEGSYKYSPTWRLTHALAPSFQSRRKDKEIHLSKSDFNVGLDGSSGIGGKGGKDGEPSGPREVEGKQPAGLAREERSGEVLDLERPTSPPERDFDLPRDLDLFKDD